MGSQSVCLQVCVLCLVVCLGMTSQAQDGSWSRLKRGFRLDSANRVAHGYGKRGYGQASPVDFESFPLDNLRTESADLLEGKDEDWSLLSVEELAGLLQTHPKLTRSLIKKVLDTNNDGMISASELFRPRN